MTTTTTEDLANVPIPAGARIVCDWHDPSLPIDAGLARGPGARRRGYRGGGCDELTAKGW